ncbi:MAG TPA: APC family permease [Bryobacteraceae bacterium]|nr:APC family permease [Bryobacteraceae bacterium]
MGLMDLLLGRPLATEEEKAERIGPAKGLPIFGLDALSSAAYGPEAALTLLIPLGMAGVAYIVPISISIIILLGIVYFSYRQTIMAYPLGGGSYTVASENLGVWPGLLAAASLMVDYILTAAVGISAGVGALISAVPSLEKHTLALCLFILLLVTLVNLRGVSETGGIFLIPAYLFVFCLLTMIVLGAIKTLLAGGHPIPVVAPPHLAGAVETVSLWLLLRAFASGCTALTGVEAVSNGVMAFKEPAPVTARFTLTLVIAILVAMLLGVAFLSKAYGIAATAPGQQGYQSVLSQLLAAVAGTGVFYGVSIASILAVLALSANTAFADFPRLARAISLNGFLPHGLAMRGRRLVYTQGVYALGFAAAVLLILFGGVTDNLIPLYAVGAFLAFTISQAGMVVHWRRVGGPGATKSMFINGLGAAATGITVLVVLVAKFTEGAWITLLLIPLLILMMRMVRRHYNHVALETYDATRLNTRELTPPIVVITMDRWTRITHRALRFAMSISPDVVALHVDDGVDCKLPSQWASLVEEPARQAGLTPPPLTMVDSPYRFVIRPVLDFVLNLEKKNPHRLIAVLIPELVERRWYYNLLHNHRSAVLKALLLFQGDQRITVINIPWYLPTDPGASRRGGVG